MFKAINGFIEKMPVELQQSIYEDFLEMLENIAGINFMENGSFMWPSKLLIAVLNK